MISTFLDSLRNQQPLFETILNVCHAKTLPIFIDLCWGDTFDTVAAFHDPGIEFDVQGRQLVLLRVNNEIRYYVGPKDPSANDFPQEIGVLPTEADALSFAYEYIVKRLQPSEIKVERVVRSRIS